MSTGSVLGERSNAQPLLYFATTLCWNKAPLHIVHQSNSSLTKYPIMSFEPLASLSLYSLPFIAGARIATHERDLRNRRYTKLMSKP